MKGILLHGGHGTRLRPLTHTGPKQLLPIANKPMSQYCLESMKEAGVTELVIIVGGIGLNKVKEFYGDGTKFGLKIVYIEQDFPRGIAHAISLCENFIGNEKFLVFLGDNIIQKSIKKYYINFEKSLFDASILLCEVNNPSRFGIAEIKNNEICKIVEKPKNPKSNLAVTGIYFLTPKIFKIIKKLKPSSRGELEITDALQMLLSEKNSISYDLITDYWKDTGTPDDIINANSEIIKKLESYCYGNNLSKKTTKNIMIGKNSIISKDSELIGPVLIGDNCVIDSGAIIGPNVSIGNNSTIQKCNMSNSIVMENCHIESNIVISRSIIASNSEILSKNDDNHVFLLGEGTKLFI